MRFVSRAEWGSQYPRTPNLIPGPVFGVTCHWEGPAMGYPWPHDRCARKVRSIERFHKIYRGWSDIAYNALVCPHGYVFEGRGVGRRSAANGTSDIGGNDHWYAVCYLGGVGDPFTAPGADGFIDAIDWLRHEGNAGPEVNGHRDHHATECPGDEIYAWAHSDLEEPDMPTLSDIAKAVWNFRIPIYDGNPESTRRARVVLSQAHNRSGDNRTLLRDLARVVGDGTLSDEARQALATDIANRVDALEAAEVAEDLDITVQE